MSFEVGDKVIDLRFGEGKVTEIFTDVDYPVHVIFKKEGKHGHIRDDYTFDGRNYNSYTYPFLYHAEGFVPPSCKEPERKPECSFKPFDKVLVRDDLEHPWVPAFYSMPAIDSGYTTIASGIYLYCIPYEGNEYKCGKVTED